ncbi:helix-turn-helix domain-containing protein [Listeria innocua]|uniref:helix-turn-helix domain-containing protein n=1 Tax=Listeria innocua TaxID=1642 RepID=UPI0016257E93|nr:helix-turn-helix domain-containing protein [Listeria innocua]MBC1925522.1 helix-turn-helix domain-containing protein [Listeria innocua]
MKNEPLVSYDIIKRAVAEDEIAILYVVQHYARYIATLSMKKFKSSSGADYNRLNEATVQELEAKLMAGILKFRIPKRY